jgi:hypothetical protein
MKLAEHSTHRRAARELRSDFWFEGQGWGKNLLSLDAQWVCANLF